MTTPGSGFAPRLRGDVSEGEPSSGDGGQLGLNFDGPAQGPSEELDKTEPTAPEAKPGSAPVDGGSSGSSTLGDGQSQRRLVGISKAEKSGGSSGFTAKLKERVAGGNRADPGDAKDGQGEPVVGADLVLVGCVGGKVDHDQKVPLRDLYTTPLWKKRMAYADSRKEAHGIPWSVLSANPDITVGEHDDLESRYNKSFKPKSPEEKLSPEELKKWKRGTREKIVGKLWGGVEPGDGGDRKRIEVIAGADYLKQIRDALSGLPVDVVSPLSGMGIGTRKRTLDRMTASIYSKHYEGRDSRAAEMWARAHESLSKTKSGTEQERNRQGRESSRLFKEAANYVPGTKPETATEDEWRGAGGETQGAAKKLYDEHRREHGDRGTGAVLASIEAHRDKAKRLLTLTPGGRLRRSKVKDAERRGVQAAESAWLHAKRVHQEGGPSGLKEGVKVGESAFMPGHGEVTVVERYVYEQSRDRPEYVVEKKDGKTMAVSADELRPLESDSPAPPPKEEAKPEPKAKAKRSEIVGSDEEFEERARPLADLVGIPVHEHTIGHKPGGGPITTFQFNVGLNPVGLKAAFGNKPDPARVAAFVDAVVKEAAQLEGVPESEIREDIEGAANRSGVRARIEIKLLDAAISEIRRSTKGRHRDDRQQGEIRALELLRDHMLSGTTLKPAPKAKPAKSRKVGIRRKKARPTDREPFLSQAEELTRPGVILAGAGKKLAIGKIRRKIKNAGGDHPKTEAILARLEGGS
tara:strand:+ start:70 stop:2316 length:2247 start_codon:yes stop_codon:yes gene_type:complete